MKEVSLSVRPIVIFPDPALRVPAEPVEQFDGALRALADDLHDTIRAAPGVGITAPHIGVPLRLVVLDLPELGGRRDYANPEILSLSQETMEHTEGSVSMPGATETVTRPRVVDIRFRDLDGAIHEERLEGFAAICMQHEIDQLDGMFWLQRLSKLKRDRLIRRWEKSRK